MDKLELENMIYAYACVLQQPVWAKAGRLFTPSKDKTLCVLLGIYNAKYSKQNQSFLAADLIQTRQDFSAFWDCFEREGKTLERGLGYKRGGIKLYLLKKIKQQPAKPKK